MFPLLALRNEGSLEGLCPLFAFPCIPECQSCRGAAAARPRNQPVALRTLCLSTSVLRIRVGGRLWVSGCAKCRNYSRYHNL